MRITASRIKEIIREELSRMNEEPLKYRPSSPYVYEPVEKGSEAEDAARNAVGAATGNYDMNILGVRRTDAGETEYLVERPDGTKDVINTSAPGPDPEDVDSEIDRRRGDKPMMEGK